MSFKLVISNCFQFIFTVGWVVSGILWSLAWWAGIDSGSTHYRYNVTSAAQYAAFTPIAAAVPIAWVIYAVHNGCSGKLLLKHTYLGNLRITGMKESRKIMYELL